LRERPTPYIIISSAGVSLAAPAEHISTKPEGGHARRKEDNS
jgi:hypothetical protein